MKIISISDEDTNIMFQLIGIQGYIITTNEPDLFKEEFDKILEDPEIGLILMNEKYLVRQEKYFKKLKLKKLPIIVEIPDLKAPFKEKYFRHIIEQFLGLTAKEV